MFALCSLCSAKALCSTTDPRINVVRSKYWFKGGTTSYKQISKAVMWLLSASKMCYWL